MLDFQVADYKLLAHLILVMLERSSLLLCIPKYTKEIHRYEQRNRTLPSSVIICHRFGVVTCFLSLCRVFSCQLLRLCKLHPSLVVDQSHELLEFAGATVNVYNKEDIYTHVVIFIYRFYTII